MVGLERYFCPALFSAQFDLTGAFIQDWSSDLEESSQEEAEKCEAVRAIGTNIFYNTTGLSDDKLEAFAAIVAPWLSGDTVQQVGGSVSPSYQNTDIVNL